MTKFLGKTLLLVTLVVLLQLTVCAPFHQSDPLKKFENCLAQHPDVIYFCDSCNAWIDTDDTDRRMISEQLNDQLLNKKVARLDGGAFHLELYEAFVELLAARGVRPDALIIPLNLRSFSAEWDARPAYSFHAAQQQLRRADNHLASAFAPLMKTLQWERAESSSLIDYRNTAVYDGAQVVGTVGDFDNSDYRTPTPELLRKKFIFHYMYALPEDHRKLAAMRRIAQLAAKEKLRVVFYVTPIDYETGTACLGPRFSEQVSANIANIGRQLSDYPVSFVDWSHALDAQAFSWTEYPNEHLNERGRSFVATHLAELLADQYAFQLNDVARMATTKAVAANRR